MKAFGTMFVGGFVGLLALKVLTTVMVPAFGMALALLALALKLGIFFLVGLFLYKIFRRRRDRNAH